MSSSEIDMARSTKRAWKRYRRALADRIERLEEHEFLLIALEGPAPEDGCVPFVQVQTGNDRIAAEATPARLGKPSRRALRELGWERPGGCLPSFWMDADLGYSDKVADVLVRTLRDVFGVVHPAFLTGDIEVEEEARLPSIETPEDEPLVVCPVDEHHLNRLIDEALVPMIGHRPTRDSDGDVGMVCGSAVVFVRLLPDRPMIRIFSEIVLGVTDTERAAFEVNVLNRDNLEVKFRLVDDRIIAETCLLGAPFVPSQLRHTLAMMCELVERSDKDLAHRVSGHTFIDAPPVLTAMPPAVRALFNLEKAKPGVLTPELVAEVCGHDAELIRRLVEGYERGPRERSRRTQVVLRQALKITRDK